MKISRREFMQHSAQLSAATLLSGIVGVGTLTGCGGGDGDGGGSNMISNPNILLIMVDQMQTPPEGYAPDEGPAEGLKEILGFRQLSSNNPYAQYFPGLLRLRRNAVVLRKHYTASSACVPSRACIMTGQYPSSTGVDQTDGLYKSPGDVTWLDPDGAPTVGDWFRSVGYTTHYFGKWHVSDPHPPDYLEPWGFADWDSSFPEAHGGAADNLGAFRDVEFANRVSEFLAQKGSDASTVPWLAVASLVNPHDCGAYPVNWQVPNGAGVVPWTDYPPPISIPGWGEASRPGGVNETNTVGLNPEGFPQDNSTLPRTYTESLDDKPRCQKDYALKWGLAMEANTNVMLQRFGAYRSPLPFQLQGEFAADWSLKINQFYLYCMYLAELQIRKILQALDDNGLTDKTIVVFLSDHGDMTGAHGGMIQKWHNAYEETIRVPMVFSSPMINTSSNAMREIRQPTSSVDFAPTVLGLAGYDAEQVRQAMESARGKSAIQPFAGSDLSAHVVGNSTGGITWPDGTPRTGVFFMTNDRVTERGANPDDPKPAQYQAFMGNVNRRISQGLPLVPGPVRQPNTVRALCTGDWKIARYADPNGVEPDEWELYCLTADPVEQTNLVDFRTGDAREDIHVPGMTTEDLRLKTAQLRAELARQEHRIIGKSA
jgi:arylsulfatase A-like enzyme